MSNEQNVFSSDYAEARDRFREAAKAAGGRLVAYPIDAKGPGYRPNRALAEAKIFNKKNQSVCAFPSVVEERHPAVLYESMIRRRGSEQN